jgi:hypothetical protein
MEIGCKDNKHKPRDNKFGVTWCIICGRLFTKPSNKPLESVNTWFESGPGYKNKLYGALHK